MPIVWEGAVHVFIWNGAVVYSTYFGTLLLGYVVHLGAVWAARSPTAAPLLDALRGANPRPQAAFIYAPGFALFLVGLLVGVAARGAQLAVEGHYYWGLLTLLPALVGVLSWPLAQSLMVRWYVPATAVVGEIDAQWATLGMDEKEEGLRVYLDWMARGRPELLRCLQQGWRRLRVWPVAGWGIGILAVIPAWREDTGLLTWVVALGVLGVCAIPTQLAVGDPKWLNRALGVPMLQVNLSRGCVAFLYAQGVLIPPLFFGAIRSGIGTYGPFLLGMESICVLGAIVAALLVKRWPRNAIWLYAPTAVMIWAGMGRLL